MKKLYFAGMILPLMLSACNDGREESGIGAEAALEFDHVATMAVITRAETEYTSDFKFTMPKNEDYSTDVTTTASYGTGSWEIANGPIYLSSADRELYAWAPVGLIVTDHTATLTSQKYADEQDKDILYFYKSKVSASDAKVNVLFSHAYARLSFVLSGTNYPGNKTLSAFTVKGLNASATVSLKDGSITAPAAAADLKLVETGTAAFPERLSALVVPAGSVTDLKVDCTIDAQSYNNVSLAGITELKAGNEYVVTLNIKGTEMSISSVKVNVWTPVTSSVDLN